MVDLQSMNLAKNCSLIGAAFVKQRERCTRTEGLAFLRKRSRTAMQVLSAKQADVTLSDPHRSNIESPVDSPHGESYAPFSSPMWVHNTSARLRPRNDGIIALTSCL